jgi:hypothetical protein
LVASRYYSVPLTVPSPSETRPARRVRRSARPKLTFRVLIHGKKLSGEPFREATHSLAVSLHGGLLALSTTVEKGQILLVENRATRKQQECRVVYVGPLQSGRWPVGVEFSSETRDFWGIFFPPLAA